MWNVGLWLVVIVIRNKVLNRIIREELFKMQQTSKKCKEELTLLENNISFFKNAKDDNPLLKEVRKNIERQKEKFEEIKSRMTYLRSL